MATYQELRALFNDSGLRNRVAVAIAISANKVLTGNDGGAPFSQVAGAHDLRANWAKGVFGSAEGSVSAFWQRILAQNSTATLNAITGASDTLIQSNVDEAVDLFAGVAV